MGEFIFYLIPAISFLLVAGVVILTINFWMRRFSKRSKSINKRLEEASKVRIAKSEDSLEKTQDQENVGWAKIVKKYAISYQKFSLLVIRSGSEKPASEFVLIGAGLAFGIFFLALVILRLNLLLATFLAVLGAISPWLYLSRQEKKRIALFESQFPEALDFLSRALRAGHGLTAAVGMVGAELPDPVGKEFKITFDQVNFGLAFGQSMNNFAMRVNSSDLHFLVVALLIQRETGGNLAELLENLSKTVRDRIKLAGKVKVISSEGRMSGVVMSGLPFALGTILALINPKYMNVLWTTEPGHRLMTLGLVMMAAGMFWISKIVKIKV